jgi:hypothetical protein
MVIISYDLLYKLPGFMRIWQPVCLSSPLLLINLHVRQQ